MTIDQRIAILAAAIVELEKQLATLKANARGEKHP